MTESIGDCVFHIRWFRLFQVEDKKEKLQEAQRFHFDAM